MTLEEKLTEEEVKMVAELYKEHLIELRQYSEPEWSEVEKKISSLIESKNRNFIFVTLLYIDYVKHSPTYRKRLSGLDGIKKEIRTALSTKIGNFEFLHRNYLTKDRDDIARLKKIMSFYEAKDLDELMDCYGVDFSGGLVIGKLGSGDGGSVYKVYNEDLKRYSALKLINPTKINLTEVELMARLVGQDLKNIVQIYDAGRHIIRNMMPDCYIRSINLEEVFKANGTHSILMEYVDGQTLEEILNERKLTSYEVLDYSAQILNGIQSLRKHGITHRDLNLRNIKVNSQGEVKILDFSIATDEPHPEAKNNRKFGAPKNMEADDLISFGLLVYKLATGEHLLASVDKETMGSNTYANEIDRIKPFLYQEGKISKKYRKKIANILTKHPSINRLWKYQQKSRRIIKQDSMFGFGTPLLQDQRIEILDNRERLADIILCALKDKDLDELRDKYPLPYRSRMMNIEELRELMFQTNKNHRSDS